MSMLKKKTRKAIQKSLKKIMNKHGPALAEHLATGVAAALATYLGTGGKKSRKQLEKVAKSIPGGKRILKVVSSNIPTLKSEGDGSSTNGHTRENARGKRSKPSKKHEPT
jgi:hypothetical protein